MAPLKKNLATWVERALREALGDAGFHADVEDTFEIPKEERFGDLSTHVAMKVAKERRVAPRPLADKVQALFSAALPKSPLAGRIERVTVEGPGFLNFYFTHAELYGVIERIENEREAYGRPRLKSRKILLEYVSANPTGPLTVAHGRQAALGDSLARILRFCGHEVTTEYYNNDEGVQISTLGKSTEHRAEDILSGGDRPLPEDYYKGEYLIAIARKMLDSTGIEKFKKFSPLQKAEHCRVFARNKIMEGIKKDLTDFDVHFDSYYSQEELGRSGKVEKTLEDLRKKDVVFEEDGAVWLRSTSFGDDKDRVLVKSDGHYTYLTPDIAYHHEKFSRGFDTLIDILGPDHHGYIARLKASQAALGHDASRIHVLIAQLVTLYEGSKQVRMSTRAGEFVTLREILDEVGKDAGRFFFLMRKFDAHLDFDLALAKSQTPDNPVFYIQYAHARIESVRTLARDKGVVSGRDHAALAKLTSPSETQLLRLLSQLEDTLLGAERTLEPFRLVPYLKDLAGAFHRFYTENRVVTEDAGLTEARLRLSEATQTVIRSGLALLGISAPTKM